MLSSRLFTALAVAAALSGCATLPPGDRADKPDLPAPDTAVKPAPAAPAPVSAVVTSPAQVEPKPAVPATPPDLWQRIRSGFRMAERDEAAVERELSFFSRRPEYIARCVDRAEPYLHYIVEEIERRGLPMELALLPVVESAFQPFAYSRGRASGIWQFIPSTGRHFGLKQTWWYDGRRDIVASTNAALSYLERLYAQFNDWELALAAYNAGEGTVARAIRANERKGLPTDFWNLKLPRETRSYVPRMLAIKALFDQPERYGVTLRSLPDQPYLTVVDVGSQIDLALAAELAGMSVEEFYRLNPGFNRWATDPEGPHLLVLPLEKAPAFEQALAALPEEKRLRWERHKVARGDTLSAVAARYRTTIQMLKEVNDLSSNHLRAGQYLIVPVAARAPEHYVLSEAQRLVAAQSQEREGRKRIHTVKSGDTLWEISRRYGVSTQQIAKWNGMSTRDRIRPGQALVVWTSERGGSGAAVASRNSSKPVTSGGSQTVRYTVRRGDSLYEIARKFNVSVDDLRRWNNLSKKGYLQPGQRLVVQSEGREREESI